MALSRASICSDVNLLDIFNVEVHINYIYGIHDKQQCTIVAFAILQLICENYSSHTQTRNLGEVCGGYV